MKKEKTAPKGTPFIKETFFRKRHLQHLVYKNNIFFTTKSDAIVFTPFRYIVKFILYDLCVYLYLKIFFTRNAS